MGRATRNSYPNTDTMTTAQDPNHDYKVGEVLDRYGLTALHEQLPGLWLGDTGEEHSLRTLEHRINVALVRTALTEAGEEPLEGEAENVYRLLTEDGVSTGVSVQQRNRLDRAGVDVEQLERDFVTHQAVHTYLRKGLDVSKDSETNTDPVEKHSRRIQRLRSRLDAVMGQSLSEVQAEEDFTAGRLDTTVSLQVFCRDCQTQFDLAAFLERGGCDCDGNASS